MAITEFNEFQRYCSSSFQLPCTHQALILLRGNRDTVSSYRHLAAQSVCPLRHRTPPVNEFCRACLG